MNRLFDEQAFNYYVPNRRVGTSVSRMSDLMASAAFMMMVALSDSGA